VEDAALLALLLVVERALARVAAAHPGRRPPTGALTAISMVVWGNVRALDERLWLGEEGHLGSLLVQAAGVALAVGGILIGVAVIRNWRAFVAAPAETGAVDRARLAGP